MNLSSVQNAKCAFTQAIISYIQSLHYDGCATLGDATEPYVDYKLLSSDCLEDNEFRIDVQTKYDLIAKYVPQTTYTPQTTDNAPPIPLTYFPTDNAVDVDANSNAFILFNESISLGPGYVYLFKSSGVLVFSFNVATSPYINVSGSTLNILTSSLLDEGESYYFLISSDAIRDLNNNYWTGISSPTTWNFTTAISNVAPVVSSVAITHDASLTVGDTITLTYSYSDVDGDLEGSSLIQWYSYTNTAGAGELLVQTGSLTYSPTVSDITKYIRAKVTPYALTGASPGLPVFSNYSSQVSANAAPVATTPTISGNAKQGVTLTASYSYSDVDGDLQGSSLIQWYTYTDVAGTLGEALVGSGSTYVVQAGDVGKYIRVKVTPVALTGTSPGLQVTSAVTERVYTSTLAYTVTTTKQTGFQVDQTGGIGAIEWGDGSVTRVDWTTNQVTTKNYSAPGTYVVNIFCTPTSVTRVNFNNQGLTSANISSLTAILDIRFLSNSGLASFTPASTYTGATPMTMIWIQNGTFTSLNLSAYTLAAGTLIISTLPSLNSLTLMTTSQTLSQVTIAGLSSLASLNASGLSRVQTWGISTCTILSSITFAVAATNLSALTITNYTGTSLNLSNFGTFFGGNVMITSNVNLTSITFPTSSRSTSLQLQSNALTTLDISMLSNISFLRINSNPLTTTLTLPTTAVVPTTIEAIGTSRGSLSFSSFSGGSPIQKYNDNLSLTSLTLAIGSNITTLWAYGCSNLNLFSIATANFGTSSIDINLRNNSWTAAEVNEMLVNLNNRLSTGTGTIRIDGTNAAPDTTSGGFNGTVAASAIALKGYTLTTT